MESALGVAAVGVATAFSIGLALALECLLLRVILRYVAKAHAEEAPAEAAAQSPAAVRPEDLYRELRSPAR